MNDQNQLSQAIKNEAKKQGFNPVGIAKIPGGARIQTRTASLQRWLEAGHHADMKWMEAPRRENIESLLNGAKSVLAVGLNYYVEEEKAPNSLSIARYAWGKDYHKTIKQRLKKIGQWLEKERPNSRWKICVDSSPLLDKAWAEEAGIGWIGKNSNLINPKLGSWMVIGHLICTEPLTPDEPETPLCGKCQDCLEACPTKAISEPFVVDARRCLAYHTIENRNKSLPEEIKKSLGTWVAGCDICQDVCPWNQKSIPSSSDPDVIPKKWILNLTREEALQWDDKQWNEKTNESALKRIKPWMWRRNIEATKKNKPSTLNTK